MGQSSEINEEMVENSGLKPDIWCVHLTFLGRGASLYRYLMPLVAVMVIFSPSTISWVILPNFATTVCAGRLYNDDSTNLCDTHTR